MGLAQGVMGANTRTTFESCSSYYAHLVACLFGHVRSIRLHSLACMTMDAPSSHTQCPQFVCEMSPFSFILQSRAQAENAKNETEYPSWMQSSPTWPSFFLTTFTLFSLLVDPQFFFLSSYVSWTHPLPHSFSLSFDPYVSPPKGLSTFLCLSNSFILSRFR